jgi:hypothetical protein
MASFHYECSEFRDLGDRVVAIGRFRTRGSFSRGRAAPVSSVCLRFCQL